MVKVNLYKVKKSPLISVIIPVKNGEKTIEACLKAIRSQTLFHETEVVIIDSGSTDATLALLSKYPEVVLLQIDPESFNHGATRNFGASVTKGEFILMTVQDACPANERWLENLVSHFKDEKVAGVCGMQYVPHHSDKNPHEWFRPISKPKVHTHYYPDPEAFESLSPKMKNEICSWDNVNAMYRRQALLTLPFQKVSFGEDMLWAKSALANGFKLIYDSHAKVEHYHEVDYEYMYRRTLTSVYFRYKFFNVVPENLISYTDYAKVIYRNINRRLPIRWIVYNWNAFNAYNKAVSDFTNELLNDKNNIDKFYHTICPSVPLAQLKKQK